AHDIAPFNDDIMSRLSLAAAQGLALFTAATLFAEGAGWDKTRRWLLMAVGAGVIAAFCFIPDHFTAAQLFFGGALALTMIFAPYIARGASEDSVWRFNYLNGIGLIIAGISTFVLCAGLSAILGSLNYLFPVLDVPPRVFGDIWIFGGFFFGPVAFLYQIPRQFDFQAMDWEVPKGISFIANFLVVPLVLIYTFILYVYFAKIVALWELPKGNLAWLVTGFGAAGVAARLAVFPMQHTGTILLQQFYKFFSYLLIVPLILLSIGIYTRLSQYGVTEERYAIALCLVWLAGLTLHGIARPQRQHIKFVPMALAALLLAASFGPWGAVSVSENSQLARLEGLLQQAGVMTASGQLVKTTVIVPFETRKEIGSILDYFYQGDKTERIAHLEAPFKKEMDDKATLDGYERCGTRSFSRCWNRYDRSQKLMAVLGMEYVSPYATTDSEQDYTVRANSIDWNADGLTRVSGYDYVVRFYAYAYNQNDWSAEKSLRENGAEVISAKFLLGKEGKFTVTLKDGRSVVFDLQPLLAQLYAEKVKDIAEESQSRLILRAENAGLRAELRISELRGNLQGDKIVFNGATMTVLLAP
ncbi:MAG TPA: DUF4153 domain-containing protein, partial [Patescibacteria group bacterium]|nr:DUF4153 domain-containing protein [Patescibacteria group bacterium]